VDSNANQPRDTVKFWDGDNVALAASIWKHIASRYVGEPVLWGYDLFNEPVPQPGREYELLPSLITIRDAIRDVDNNHIIVAEGSWWSSDLTKIDWTDPMVQSITGYNEQWDDNLVYQLHHYGPASGTYGREAFAEKLNIPVFIGEYGETDEANLKAITDWAKETLEGYFPW
jgi:aryl-phospho-beta-D-glucosidase BglC (GH1 family)